MKDDTLTTQASSMHVGQTRTRAHSHSLNCSSPVLKKRHTSFSCKSTQTDCNVPGSAGKRKYSNFVCYWYFNKFILQFVLWLWHCSILRRLLFWSERLEASCFSSISIFLYMPCAEDLDKCYVNWRRLVELALMQRDVSGSKWRKYWLFETIMLNILLLLLLLGTNTLLIPLIESQVKNNGQDLNLVSNSCSHQLLLYAGHRASKRYGQQLSEYGPLEGHYHAPRWLGPVNGQFSSTLILLFLAEAMSIPFVSLFSIRWCFFRHSTIVDHI